MSLDEIFEFCELLFVFQYVILSWATMASFMLTPNWSPYIEKRCFLFIKYSLRMLCYSSSCLTLLGCIYCVIPNCVICDDVETVAVDD